MTDNNISLVLFDFGGVLAEEGFREGLMAIGAANGLVPQDFYHHAVEIISSCGYLTGLSDEKSFWEALRLSRGITGPDEALRSEILSRFEIRPWMLEQVEKLKAKGIRCVILSDQTNWLDELDARHGFFKLFDRVFNSYHIRKSKHDPSVFEDVLRQMQTPPPETLFIDDNSGHIERAAGRGLQTLLYHDRETFMPAFLSLFPHVGTNF